jgi:hypothetical protein
MATLISNPTGLNVATFLGRQADTVFVAQCDSIVTYVRAQAASYTRDKGFESDTLVPDDIFAAILSRSARTAVNPLSTQTESVDGVTNTDRWAGDWNRGEQRLLNRYRVKSM